MAQGEIAEALAAFQRGKYFQSTSYSIALPWDDRINAALRRLREGQGVTPK
jgi:hypothetical protein